MDKSRLVGQHTADPVANLKASHRPATGLQLSLDTPGNIESAFRYDAASSGSHIRDLLHRIRDLALVFLGWLAPVAQDARDTQNEAQRIVEENRRYQETDEKLKALAAVMKEEWSETVLPPAA